MDVEAYLRRIGYDGPRTPAAVTLRALHVAHLRTVPFENLSIHLREPIVLDDDALFEKVVVRRRGGFCYELNGLFVALLRALGFDVAMLSAGVMGATGEFGPDFDHMTLLVTPADGGGPWLADVGFGDCFLEPIAFRAGEEVRGRDRWMLQESAGQWLLSRAIDDGAPKPQYRFTTAAWRLGDYAGMCEFHRTSRESPFTRQRVCTMATPNGRVTLTGTRLVTTKGGAKEERVLGSEEECVAVLSTVFGVDLSPALKGPAGGAGHARPLLSPSRGTP